MRAPQSLPQGVARVLLVEGGDEEAVVSALVSRGALHVWVVGGQDDAQLERVARLVRSDPSYGSVRALAAVLDAEEAPAEAWRKVCDVAVALGFPAPAAPGAVIEADGRTFSGLVIPPHGTGAIESLLRACVADASVVGCCDGLFQCVGSTFATQAQRDKAWMNVWAATQDPKQRWHQLLHRPSMDLGAAPLAPLRAFLAAFAAR